MNRARLLAVLAAALVSAAVPAHAENQQDGNLRVSFDSSLKPSALPRDEPVPVAITVSGQFRTLGDQSASLPQLRRISVAINRQGTMFDRGLDVCRAGRIWAATQSVARRLCGGAIIGNGSVGVRATLPNQPPFEVAADLLAFNGPTRNGQKLILAQAYSRRPPGSFILTFRVSHRDALFGTVLTTDLPRSARRWAYLTHFDMRLHRTYEYRGRRRSYVSAACEAPPGFNLATFPFARASYSFSDGRSLQVSVARSCRVAD